MIKKALLVLMLMAIAPVSLHAEETSDNQFDDESSLQQPTGRLSNMLYVGAVLSTANLWYQNFKIDQLSRQYNKKPAFSLPYAIGKHFKSAKRCIIVQLAFLGASMVTNSNLVDRLKNHPFNNTSGLPEWRWAYQSTDRKQQDILKMMKDTGSH